MDWNTCKLYNIHVNFKMSSDNQMYDVYKVYSQFPKMWQVLQTFYTCKFTNKVNRQI